MIKYRQQLMNVRIGFTDLFRTKKNKEQGYKIGLGIVLLPGTIYLCCICVVKVRHRGAVPFILSWWEMGKIEQMNKNNLWNSGRARRQVKLIFSQWSMVWDKIDWLFFIRFTYYIYTIYIAIPAKEKTAKVKTVKVECTIFSVKECLEKSKSNN